MDVKGLLNSPPPLKTVLAAGFILILAAIGATAYVVTSLNSAQVGALRTELESERRRSGSDQPEAVAELASRIITLEEERDALAAEFTIVSARALSSESDFSICEDVSPPATCEDRTSEQSREIIADLQQRLSSELSNHAATRALADELETGNTQLQTRINELLSERSSDDQGSAYELAERYSVYQELAAGESFADELTGAVFGVNTIYIDGTAALTLSFPDGRRCNGRWSVGTSWIYEFSFTQYQITLSKALVFGESKGAAVSVRELPATYVARPERLNQC